MTRISIYFLLLLPWQLTAGAEDPLPVSQWEAELGGSVEQLTNGYANWFGTSLEVSGRFSSGEQILGVARQVRRYRLTDDQLGAGYWIRPAAGWTLGAEAQYSFSHQVLPQWAVSVGGQKVLGKGVVVHLTARQTAYTASDVTHGIAGAEYYWDRYRVAASLFVVHVSGAGTDAAGSAGISYYYDERNSINTTVAVGREVENLGALGTIAGDVLSLSAGGRHWFSGHVAVSWLVFLHRQGTLYSRRGISIGLRYAL
ncbi:MAG: YaiO family outer membrane beta-barrel protein [Ignavibacteria bacterium]|nr:YaiO family outer membrane beta-barrel protein [Ignavibacteria bacterium]